MKLLVLAGGFGTRLQSVVAEVPKALAPVGDVPFLRLQIEHWKNQGVNSFLFLLHHQAELIIDFLKNEKNDILNNSEVEWLVEPEPMGTGGALAYAVKCLNISDDFMVTNADTWLGTGINEVWLAASPAMAVVKVGNAGRYGSVHFNERNIVSAFKEKEVVAGEGWINAGLCHLKPELFKNWNHEPFSLERISFVIWAEQGNLSAVPLRSDFIDIGIPEDYFRFCRWIESGKKGAI
ncbi:MAG: sugar phosphate nucleotidyltransferase [Deltaproteobacteria bacterium]|nr:sugar phosphate nucleotidyltransferase [Deltaproteobacteria bacterium]